MSTAFCHGMRGRRLYTELNIFHRTWLLAAQMVMDWLLPETYIRSLSALGARVFALPG